MKILRQKIPIIIYRNRILPISETFVFNQSINLSNYYAYVLGAKKNSGASIELPFDRVKLINQNTLNGFSNEALFKFLGIVPKDIFEWAKRIKPRLIHAHFGTDGAMILPLAEKLNIPLIISFLGTEATLKYKYAIKSNIGQILYILRRKNLIKKVNKVIVPSEFLKLKVLDHGFPSDKITLLHHGVDLIKFTASKTNPEYGHIVFVGRLLEIKGLNYLIEAISKIKNKHPEIFLTVIGEGPMQKEFEKQAETQLMTGFQFLGAKPHEIVRIFLERSYIFCMPSISLPSGQTEAFGLVFAEAQAMGIPIVSFNSGGIPEVVKNGETGILVEEKNVDKLADAIQILMQNRNLRNKMGMAGRKRVELYFDLKKQNEKLEILYDEILSNSKT